MNREQKIHFWQKHINAWQQSDLSQAEYVRRNNLSAQSFKYYKRYLLPPEVQIPQSFIPVVVEDEPEILGPEESGITLVTPQGLRLEMRPGFHSESLQRLLQVIA